MLGKSSFQVALVALACSALLMMNGCTPPPSGPAERREATAWRNWGNDPGGQRFVELDEITRDNVGTLEVAWTFHTGDVSDGKGDVPSTTAFEATPLLVNGFLYLCSPFNRVFALDPQTGAVHWTYDPQVDVRGGKFTHQLICRGVSYWEEPVAASPSVCARRIFTATNDARLIALDAETGRPCEGFGTGGQIDLSAAVGAQLWKGEYQVTSPPAVIDDRIIVGASISDNNRISAPSGVVRAFDARSGRQVWAWDLAPPGFEHTTENSSAEGFALGTPNVWAPMAIDTARDLIVLPTGNAAPDYYRGERAHMAHYGSSVIALRASTGELVWNFATVHNDLWDYDVPAQPVLTTIHRDGAEIPVVVQATKTGLLFILHRETGVPVFPVEERPVPQDGVPGERLSPTQPFPVKPPPLIPHQLSPDDAWGLTPFDRGACRQLLESLRYEGIYTPPTIRGTLAYPSPLGGAEWGGLAVHPTRHIAVGNMNNITFSIRLVPREQLEEARRQDPGHEYRLQSGTPYAVQRFPLLSPFRLPCNPPPWGMLAAIDLSRGEILWQEPFGTVGDLTPLPLSFRIGAPNVGGPIITSQDLVFIGATKGTHLRAFDLMTGRELWKGRLPASGQATPMGYRIGRKPYIVIAAGGSASGRARVGDAVVAFTLPD